MTYDLLRYQSSRMVSKSCPPTVVLDGMQMLGGGMQILGNNSSF